MEDRLEVDDEGGLWFIEVDGEGYRGSTLLGHVEAAGDRVPEGMEDEYDLALDEWRDRFDARGEAEASWWRGQR